MEYEMEMKIGIVFCVLVTAKGKGRDAVTTNNENNEQYFFP
jgi:hypothetical protein